MDLWNFPSKDGLSVSSLLYSSYPYRIQNLYYSLFHNSVNVDDHAVITKLNINNVA